MSIQNSLSPLPRSHRPLRTVLIGTSLGSESVRVVRAGLRVPPRRVLAAVDLSTLSGDAFRCGLHLLGQLGDPEEVQVQAVYALSYPETVARQPGTAGKAGEPVERWTAEELRR